MARFGRLRLWPAPHAARLETIMRLPLLPLLFVVTVSSATSAATISVNANGDLQAAIDKARHGDHIELERGATYTGHFTLTVKDQPGPAAFITIRTAGPAAGPEGARIGPANADALAKLKSPDGG